MKKWPYEIGSISYGGQLVIFYYISASDTIRGMAFLIREGSTVLVGVLYFKRHCRGHDCMVVGFTTTYVINAHHH